MEKVKREIDIFTDEQRKWLINEIIGYFASEQDQEIGVIFAGELLDFFVTHLEPTIHNKALNEASRALKEHAEELDFKLQLLKK